eukprot:8492438-Pyramimonas_sp.AAC.1
MSDENGEVDVGRQVEELTKQLDDQERRQGLHPHHLAFFHYERAEQEQQQRRKAEQCEEMKA